MRWIKNGTIADPASGLEERADLLLDGGKIAGIFREGEERPRLEGGRDMEVIDASGMIVAPGLVDVHVHFRDPGFTHKEDIMSGARAAAGGGFTTVVLMANTKPPVDNVETLRYVLEKGKGTAIHVESCANVTLGMKGKELSPMEELAEAGAAGFTDDGIPILDEELLRRAMEKARKLGKPLSLHEEDPRYIRENGINAGPAARRLGLEGSSRQAEISLVERDLKLAASTGACTVIQHISTREAVELVREAKRAGINVHAEATPHHFTLTEEAVGRYGTLAKMNPPLREEADRLAIIEGLSDGTIDLIATDHAPHSPEEKDKPFVQAPSGIIGLETALSLGLRELVRPGYLTLLQLLERMSLAPSRLYGFPGGRIAAGAPADLTIFDPRQTRRVESFLSKSGNSPFLGEELPGTLKYSACWK